MIFSLVIANCVANICVNFSQFSLLSTAASSSFKYVKRFEGLNKDIQHIHEDISESV